MVFSSLSFIFIFLPIVLCCFYLASLCRFKLQSLILITASIIFYAIWNYQLLIVLLGSIVTNYVIGNTLYKRKNKHLLYLGVCANLLLLGFFKYFNFFLDNINNASNNQFEPWSIILPLGISFFTFQQISYLVEMSKKRYQDEGFIKYVLYVSFFPQLIAGPIVKYDDVSKQLAPNKLSKIDVTSIMTGIVFFCIGLAKKKLIADPLATIANPVFNNFDAGIASTTTDAWLGLLAYSGQIYFDFSGYSDMAIGLALLFGISLPINFNSPYKSKTIVEFWRNWHITLSRFLREYIYIPLGGNRRGKYQRYINLSLVMLIGGLWHGASWNFVIWGAIHGCYLMINHAYSSLSSRYDIKLFSSNSSQIAVNFVFVSLAWVFFRSESFSGACLYIKQLFNVSFNLSNSVSNLQSIENLLMITVAYGLIWLLPNSQQIIQKISINKAKHQQKTLTKSTVIWAGVLFSLSIFSLLIGSNNEFIYFQF